MAISRKELLEELQSLDELDFEKLLEKFERTNKKDLTRAIYMAGGGGIGLFFGPIGVPIGMVAGIVVEKVLAKLNGAVSLDEEARQVRVAVKKADETFFPKIFCVWVEKEKKNGEWLKSDGEQ